MKSNEQASGIYFIDNLSSDIESLKFTGGTHPVLYKSYFRALSKRFPWAIYYSMSQENLYIHAITDCRRDPDWIRRHLQKA